MVIQVNRELCAGCGACAEVCSAGAIQMVNQTAVIVEALCTQCEACVEACPNGAIAASTPVPNPASVVALPVTGFSPAPVQQPAVLPEVAPSGRGLAPLAGAALAFVGREVAPCLADVLLNALERRLTQPATSANVPQWASARSIAPWSTGKRRRARYRSGCAGLRIYKDRR